MNWSILHAFLVALGMYPYVGTSLGCVGPLCYFLQCMPCPVNTLKCLALALWSCVLWEECLDPIPTTILRGILCTQYWTMV